MTVDKIVDVIAVRNRLMPTTRSMNMVLVVAAASVLWRASSGVGVGYWQLMLFDAAIGVLVMQVPVV
jgi:hypothetical protein